MIPPLRPLLRLTALGSLGLLVLGGAAHAGRGSRGTIHCGDVVEGEFAKAEATHTYFLDLEPLEVLNVAVTPVGDILNLRYGWLFAPDGSRIYASSYRLRELKASVGRMSAPGTYRFVLKSLDAGVYVLQVGCVLPDGTRIEPVLPPGSLEPLAGFQGFPGLQPVNLAGLTFAKVDLAVPVEGELSGDPEEVFGIQFEGQEGQGVELTLERTAGNLDLALLLLDAGGGVVFQSSLAAGDAASTALALPATGDYTLAVAAVRLGPPEEPEPTTFRVQVTRRAAGL